MRGIDECGIGTALLLVCPCAPPSPVRNGSRPGALRPYPAPAGRRPVALRPTLSSGLPLSGILLNFQLKIINNNMNITNIKTQFLYQITFTYCYANNCFTFDMAERSSIHMEI